ncbi:uncharacterized protein [Acropora muricata]|uniref:uncharacterized protein n=1 Tax=Acropora muricata TaxID=159855 RepID=UPI0034E5E4D2
MKVNAQAKAYKEGNQTFIRSFSLLYAGGIIGHGSLIGKETGKVIAVGTRVMHCRVCNNKKSPGLGAKHHDCRANWGGSSKGMESDLAVEMLNTQKDDTFQVSTSIGDDDSTTMAMMRQQVNHEVEKWSDVNHAKKSLATNADIIQLSAAHGQDQFNTYIMPEKEITPGASQVTHLAVVRGRLCLKGKPVDSKSANEGLKSFVEWLKAKEMPVVLFAHNAKSFDCKRIIYSLQKCDLLSSFQSCVEGFVDTLILFKTIRPQRKKYSQESLVSDLLGTSYSAHDSLEDVRALQQLISYQAIMKSSFTLNYAINSTKYCLNKAVNLHSLRPLIASKVISKGMGDKIAGLQAFNSTRWEGRAQKCFD